MLQLYYALTDWNSWIDANATDITATANIAVAAVQATCEDGIMAYVYWAIFAATFRFYIDVEFFIFFVWNINQTQIKFYTNNSI